jgi:glycerol-3-phosphate O-acyltransferase / dihydroxyacetone phosphate acyltransferase
MWLLPALSHLSRAAAHVYYRFATAGDSVPRAGPVLLVANHPNSLLDPAAVAAAARRPVRFLAKAPLFTDRAVGWLVRASGSIPVHRAADDPARMAGNVETFRAAEEALAGGAAVGIFPEGTSHSEPSLVPLRTGAARIALGAAARLGGGLAIVPIGLSFPEKGLFRSEALAVVGPPIEWADLAPRGPADLEAVRDLTARIEHALRRVTLNVERWEDAALVQTAEAVHAAELGRTADRALRLARLRGVTEALARMRENGDPAWQPLARDVSRHARALSWVGLTPAELRSRPGNAAAARWTLRQAAWLGLALPLAAVGTLLFWVPYRLTGLLEARSDPLPDVRSTFKALVGAALFTAWIPALAAVGAWAGGWTAGLATLVLLPPLALLTLAVHERWRTARAEARRFFVLRRGGSLDRLRREQQLLAERLDALWSRVGCVEAGPTAR